MGKTKLCPGCHQPLVPNAPDGLCPECLVKAGLPTGMDIAADSQAEARPPAFAAPPVEEIARLFPQLEILNLIGHGGMGAVYRARQKELGRVVALKILPPDIGRDANFADRFTREARALARLNHPGIVTLYEFGRADGLYFFLMEYVDGVTLRQLLHNGRLSPREALTIVPQICDALQYAHDEGIVHRDIKPENILLDRRGRVKVADFGLAKLVTDDPLAPSGSTALACNETVAATEAGKVMGTPQYMAPEQRAHPTEVDHRADVYSLGVVFYELLTGELPLGKFAPPSSRIRGMHLDVRLDEIVLQALEKEPERRYQTAAQFKATVETFAAAPDVRHSLAEPAPASRSQGLPSNDATKASSAFWKWAAGGFVTVGAALLFVLPFGRHERIIAPDPLAGNAKNLPVAAGGSRPIVWTALHEPSCGGLLTSLAVSPHDRSRVLLGGELLGIALSLDGGDSWLGTDGLRCFQIADFTWHPTESNIVWAGTLGGPYQSTDGGRNWTPRRSGMPAVSQWTWTAPIQKILFDPNNSARLLAFGGNHQGWDGPVAEYGNVYESTNSGHRWRRLGTVQARGDIVAAAFAADSSTMLYAAVKDYGVCVSDNGGTTWQPRTNGLPGGRVRDLAVHPSNRLVAYVAMHNRPLGTGQFAAGGVWMTTDGGTSWVARNVGLRQNTGNDANYVSKFKAIAIHPLHPNRLVTVDTAQDKRHIYLSSDGGESWRECPGGSLIGPSGTVGAAFDPRDADTVFGFGAEFVLRSTNGGHTWQDISSKVVEGEPGVRGRGCAGWVTTRFRWHPTDPQRSIFAGLNYGFGWQSRNGRRSWTRGSGLLAWGGASDVAWGPKDVVYMACGQDGAWGGIARSFDGGDNFTLLKGAALGLPEDDHPRSVYARPDVPGEVWVCWNGLRRSTNYGASWTNVAMGGNPRWLAGDPNDPQRIYACSSEGVWQCTNGATFQLLLGSPVQVTRLTVDTAGRVFAVNWRQSGGGLYRFATNRWTQIRSDQYIRDVAVDPRNPQRLMVVSCDNPFHDETSATGVWTSEDDGRTWQQQNLGLPHLAGMCVSVSPHDPDLWIVGTGGRGFFMTRWTDASKSGQGTKRDWRNSGHANSTALTLGQPEKADADFARSKEIRTRPEGELP